MLLGYGKGALTSAPGTPGIAPRVRLSSGGKLQPTQRTSPPCTVPPPLLALPVMGGGVCVFFFCEEGESELCLAALYYSLHNCYVLLEI